MAINLLGSGNAKVDWGDIAAIAGATEFSVAAIITPTASPASDLRIVGQWPDAWLLQAAATDGIGLVVREDVSNQFYGRRTGSLLANGTTSRIVATIAFGSPPTIHIYVNGVDESLVELIGSQNVAAMKDVATSVAAGHESGSATDGLDGDYSDFAMWTRVLTSTEAGNITGANHFSPLCYDTNLVFYARMTNTSSLTDEIGSVAGTNTNGTNATHPDVDYTCGAPATSPDDAKILIRPVGFA